MNIKRALYSSIFFTLCFVLTDNAFSQDDENSRNQRVKEFCEANPDNKKCEKFLDSRYQRFKDVEKDDKDKFEENLKQNSRIESLAIKRELITFCRDNPDSSRCINISK